MWQSWPGYVRLRRRAVRVRAVLMLDHLGRREGHFKCGWVVLTKFDPRLLAVRVSRLRVYGLKFKGTEKSQVGRAGKKENRGRERCRTGGNRRLKK